MNNYKELVEYLRKMHNVMLHNDNVESGVPEENITDVDAIACKEAADVIERLARDNNVLIKERNAAVADLRAVITSSAAWLNFCDFCKYQEPDGQCFHDCTPYNDKWGWQWHGVK